MNTTCTNQVGFFQNRSHSSCENKPAGRAMLSCSGILLLVSLLVCSLFPATMSAQTGPFLNLSAIPIGSDPWAVATGDLNGDGNIDIVVSGDTGGSVYVMLGNGDGTYQSPTSVPLPFSAQPRPIAIADLNHDGKADLIVGFNNATSFVVLLGNGDGTFSPGVSYPTGGTISSILVGDFTGDGIPDVVTVGQVTGQTSFDALIVFPGKGDGTFGLGLQGGTSAIPATVQLGGIAAADFDQNGTLDVVLVATLNTGLNGFACILSNDGRGNLTCGSPIALPSGAAAVATGDFNGDGHVDVAVALPSTNDVEVLIGNGDGTFQPAVSYAVGQSPLNLVAADVNADGKLDLVTSNNGDNSLSVLRGNGDGTFKAAASYATLGDWYGLATADINRDGYADVVVANRNLNQNTVQVFLSTSGGSLVTGTYPTGGFPTYAVTGDFNGDGHPDIAVMNAGGSAPIALFLGDGQGGFSSSTLTSACAGYGYTVPVSLVAGHFLNLTSDQIIAVCSSSSDSTEDLVALYSSNSPGALPMLDSNIALPSQFSFAAADVKGDGFTDLLVADGFGDVEYLTGVPTLDLFSLGSTGATSNLVVGDFNGDGNVDVALVPVATPTTTLFLSNASGAFTTVNYPLTPAAAALSGDFNGDGLSDLLLDTETQTIAVALSNGDGTFEPGGAVNLDTGNYALAVGDFNGDGVQDLVTANYATGYDLILGAPDGSFLDADLKFGKYTSYFPVVADFDQNGSADLVLVNSSDNTITVLLNKNHFSPTSTTLSNLSPTGLVSGQSVTLSAMVASKTGTPAGEVTFKLAGVPDGSAELSGGSAQMQISTPLTVGPHRFTALYTGNETFSGSLSSVVVVTVRQAMSTTTLTSNPSAPKLGQSFTVTATVAPQFVGEPTGTIQFYSDGEPVASSPILSGQATTTLAETTMGKHKIEATYSGDANFVTSAGVLTVTIGKAVSTVTLSASANPAFFGSPVTITASVIDSEGAIATGPVVFKEGATIYGTVSLSGGLTQFTLPNLPIGSHKITAQYGGDTGDGSANGTLTEVIQGAPSITSVVTDTEPSTFGQSVTFTATISSAAGTPDGTLTFKNGSAVLGTVTVSGGQALLSVSSLAAGTHTITAAYNGGSADAASSATLQQIVEKASTTLALSSSPNPATNGTLVTFTAVVSSAAAQVPTGNVTFKSGKTTLGTVALVNGQAQLSTSLLSKGAQTVTASYAATANFSASNGSLSQTMQ